MNIMTESMSMGTALTIITIIVSAAIGVGYFKAQNEKLTSDLGKNAEYMNNELLNLKQSFEKDLTSMRHEIGKYEINSENSIKDLTTDINAKLDKIDILFKETERKHDELISNEIKKLIDNLKELEDSLKLKDNEISKRIANLGGELNVVKKHIIKFNYFRKSVINYEIPLIKKMLKKTS